MRNIRFIATTIAVVVLSLPASAVTFTEGVPLYTNADLDRMFGPAPQSTAPAVSKTQSEPEDWSAIESFIDRENARIDADRQFEMQRQAYAGSGQQPMSMGGYYGGYGYYPSLGLGYPASTWWNKVSGRYYRPQNPQLPFGNTQLPRALPPGGLHPTLRSHPTAHAMSTPGVR
jgi:hypothetical protein